MAYVVFAGGLSLSFIENPEFIIFCKKMRPSYDVPKWTIISNRLFNLKYEKIQTSIHKTVEKADFISIASDGWTNLRKEPIVNFIINTLQPIFWKAIEIKESAHTGQYIAQELDNIIEEVRSEKLAAIITDNASNMKSAHSILKNKYPNTIFLGIVNIF